MNTQKKIPNKLIFKTIEVSQDKQHRKFVVQNNKILKHANINSNKGYGIESSLKDQFTLRTLQKIKSCPRLTMDYLTTDCKPIMPKACLYLRRFYKNVDTELIDHRADTHTRFFHQHFQAPNVAKGTYDEIMFPTKGQNAVPDNLKNPRPQEIKKNKAVIIDYEPEEINKFLQKSMKANMTFFQNKQVQKEEEKKNEEEGELKIDFNLEKKVSEPKQLEEAQQEIQNVNEMPERSENEAIVRIENNQEEPAAQEEELAKPKPATKYSLAMTTFMPGALIKVKLHEKLFGANNGGGGLFGGNQGGFGGGLFGHQLQQAPAGQDLNAKQIYLNSLNDTALVLKKSFNRNLQRLKIVNYRNTFQLNIAFAKSLKGLSNVKWYQYLLSQRNLGNVNFKANALEVKLFKKHVKSNLESKPKMTNLEYEMITDPHCVPTINAKRMPSLKELIYREQVPYDFGKRMSVVGKFFEKLAPLDKLQLELRGDQKDVNYQFNHMFKGLSKHYETLKALFLDFPLKSINSQKINKELKQKAKNLESLKLGNYITEDQQSTFQKGLLDLGKLPSLKAFKFGGFQNDRSGMFGCQTTLTKEQASCFAQQLKASKGIKDLELACSIVDPSSCLNFFDAISHMKDLEILKFGSNQFRSINFPSLEEAKTQEIEYPSQLKKIELTCNLQTCDAKEIEQVMDIISSSKDTLQILKIVINSNGQELNNVENLFKPLESLHNLKKLYFIFAYCKKCCNKSNVKSIAKVIANNKNLQSVWVGFKQNQKHYGSVDEQGFFKWNSGFVDFFNAVGGLQKLDKLVIDTQIDIPDPETMEFVASRMCGIKSLRKLAFCFEPLFKNAAGTVDKIQMSTILSNYIFEMKRLERLMMSFDMNSRDGSLSIQRLFRKKLMAMPSLTHFGGGYQQIQSFKQLSRKIYCLQANSNL